MKSFQEIVKEGRAGEAANIAQLQAKLDALSPEERKSPAYLIDHGRGMYTLGTKDDDDVVLPVQPNPAFYDQSIAPSVPQLLWVCLPGLQGVVDSTYQMYAGEEREQEKQTAERRLADAIRIRDKLNWAALEALVKPEAQYFGRLGSTSSLQRRMPPARFVARKPAAHSRCTASALRNPERQYTTMSR